MGSRFRISDLRVKGAERDRLRQSRTGNQKLKSAFTLIELVLVMFVLTITLSVVAPSLRGWSKGGKLRDAGDQFLAATRFARSAAVSTASMHQLQVDASQERYMIVRLDGEYTAAAAGEFSREVVLPTGVRMQVSRLDGSGSSTIEFYPNGRTTPVQVRLISDWGDFIELSAITAAEPFRDTSGRSQ
jgi:type II secretion system protein H